MIGNFGSAAGQMGGAMPQAGGAMGGRAAMQPSFWQQMMQRRQLQAQNGAQQAVGGGVPGASGLTAGGYAANGAGPAPVPGQNMDQMQSANPQLAQIRARAAAMQAGGAMPQQAQAGQQMSFGAQKPMGALQAGQAGRGQFLGSLGGPQMSARYMR
jgi:hypothetical protein